MGTAEKAHKGQRIERLRTHTTFNIIIMSEVQPLIGVLALQGAFEEHQACLEAVGYKTVQVSRVLGLNFD
jgi:hypothetical protein